MGGLSIKSVGFNVLLAAALLLSGTLASKSKNRCKLKKGAEMESLIARAERQRELRVIVRLCVDFVPEGELSSDRKVQNQRRLIAQTQARLLKSLARYKVELVSKYEYAPLLAVRVNAAALRSLTKSSLVAGIEEDVEVPSAP